MSNGDSTKCWCRECTAEYKREWARANRDKVRAIKNAYYERNKERIVKDTRAKRKPYSPEDFQKRDRQKVRARTAVNNAVRAGKMPRASELMCADCGNPADQYDHIGGYEKDNYLNVEAVCTTCHGRRARARDECNQRE
jgi:hypothetical protein